MPSVKALLKQAAASSNKNVTEFLLDAGLSAAEDVLGDQRSFRLDGEAWRVFAEVLEHPVTGHQRHRKRFLITTQAKCNLSSRSGIGGVRSAT